MNSLEEQLQTLLQREKPSNNLAEISLGILRDRSLILRSTEPLDAGSVRRIYEGRAKLNERHGSGIMDFQTY